jgi:uncharacterized protein YhaN
MWIKGIKIDGFGYLKDLEIDNLSPGLNIIYGNNEKGKTTLKNFINSIIFGFYKKGNVKRYEPVEGKTHGGKLVFNYQGDTYEASRIYRRKSEGDLEIITNSPVKYTFSDIFSGINRDVYENIFSFGLEELSSLNSLTDKKDIVEQIYTASFGVRNDKIKETKKELEKGLDNKLLNKNLSEYKGIKKAIIEAVRREEKYGELKERLQELTAKMEEIEKEKLSLEKELTQYQTLNNLYPTYQKYLETERKIKELSYKGEYSEGDYNSLKTLISDLEKLKKELGEKEEELIKIEISLNNISLDQNLLTKKEEIKKLGEWAISIKEINKNYQNIRNKYEDLKKKISIAKINLNSKLKKDLQEIFLPLDFKRKLRDLAEKIDIKKKEKEQKGWEISQLNESFHSIKGEDLGEILSLLYQLKDLGNKKGINLPQFLVLLNAAIFALLVWQGSYPFITSLLGFTIIPLNIWLIYKWLKDKNKMIMIKSALKEKGIFDFINIDLEINKLQSLMVNYQKLQRVVEEKNFIERELEEVKREKEKLFSQVGFNIDLTIKEGLELVEEVSKIKELIEEGEGYKRNLLEGEGKISEFIQKCEKELDPIDTNFFSLDEALATVKLKLELLEKEEEKQQQYKGLKGQMEYIQKDMERILKELREKEGKYKELLEKGQVKTEQEYEENYRKFREVKKLLEEKNNYLAKLEGINYGGIDEILRIYGELNEEFLSKKISNLTEELKEIEEKGKEKSREIGKIEKEIEDLEKDHSLQQLTLKEEMVKKQITENVKKLAVYKSCLLILEKAIKEYEEKTQPDVLKRAAEYFRIITAGRYNNIKVKENELTKMSVVQSNGREVPVEVLSRGTQEQLYICIRLGLIKEFTKKKGSLPLLFDDIFVNFDEKRTELGLRVLLELAKEQQILFFTCHQRIPDLLRKEEESHVNLAFLS